MEAEAYTEYDDSGHFALSVFSVPGVGIDELARIANRPNGVIRLTTAGRIRAAGYEVLPDEPPPGHAALQLPNPPTDTDWETSRAIFDEPIRNPHRRVREAREE